ncbi:MAG: hypothetical protein KBA06_05250 [Saprospiraceae bacterium]|nr:hypothetical protein [Saprospiraceae bacterium]
MKRTARPYFVFMSNGHNANMTVIYTKTAAFSPCRRFIGKCLHSVVKPTGQEISICSFQHQGNLTFFLQ